MNGYAPVLITTLNRYEHLNRCITSLRRNRLAKETELYISVDYPPAEKYVDGYEKIKKLLEAGIEGFKDVHIIWQEQNLGSYNNYMFLLHLAEQKHDAYIFTEDDNEFSHLFLEYMNEALNLYEDDDSIVAISGHSYPIEWEEDGDTVAKIYAHYDAWGYATWVRKEHELLKGIDYKDFERNIYDGKKMRRLRKQCPSVYCAYVSIFYYGVPNLLLNEDGTINCIDSTRCMLMSFENKKMIMPKVSLVRNWGDDGSGEHVQNNGCWHTQKINEDDRLEIICNRDIYQYRLCHYLPCSKFYVFKTMIKRLLYMMRVFRNR
ncbi:MAG: glycosyltransferase [Oscillospiraceae bacterium]|nr:glycosyltransferase [Oscillospiraceae bacterium]